MSTSADVSTSGEMSTPASEIEHEIIGREVIEHEEARLEESWLEEAERPASEASAAEASAAEADRLPNAPRSPSRQAGSDLDLVRLWLDGKSAHTRRAYRTDIEQFIDFTDKPVQGVLLKDVQEYRRFLVGRGLKANTISRKLAAVKSLFTFAHEIGYVALNTGRPVSQPKARRRLGEKLLSHEEVYQLFGATSEATHSLRNLAILRLFYATGIRRSELAGLRWRDLDARPDLQPPRGQVTVWGKGQKERTVLATESTWRALMRLRAEERAAGRGEARHPVFWSQKGGALSESAIYDAVKSAAEEAGIEAKPATPHAFRHAHISHALQNGARLHVVMDTVGHSSLQTTSGYAHARPDESSSDYIRD